MFYSIAAKTSIISGKKKSLLKIFIFGSVAYVLLHYFMFDKSVGEFVDKIKSYIYYLMAIDFIVALGIYKWFSNAEVEEKPQTKYTNEEKEEIQRDLEKLRSMQAANDKQKDVFVKRNENKKSEEKQKTSSDEQSKQSKHSKKSQKSKKSNKSKHSEAKTSEKKNSEKKHAEPKQQQVEKNDENIEDTQLPVYLGENNN